MYTIRRHIELDAGHRVPFHGSGCRRLHGHRYRVTAVVESPTLVAAETHATDAGMVVDFGVIKRVLMTSVHDVCDHKLLLWEQDPLILPWEVSPQPITNPFHVLLLALGLSDGIVRLPCIPTAEELAAYWGGVVGAALKRLEPRVRLAAVEVQETPTSVAIWTAGS